ncbi:hypothetical protein Ancab_021083 [Ancistrocladus abbreviatus]
MRISVLLAKMRKPVNLNLIFMKKSARRVEKLKLLRHYNYGFIQEYQFTPSSTPLSFYNRKQFRERRKRLDMHSVLLMCSCLGRFGGEVGEDGYSMAMEALPGIEDAMILSTEMGVEEVIVSDSAGEDDGSVDERAERFIENFYEQRCHRSRKSVSGYCATIVHGGSLPEGYTTKVDLDDQENRYLGLQHWICLSQPWHQLPQKWGHRGIMENHVHA